jgi:hypothetical protein
VVSRSKRKLAKRKRQRGEEGEKEEERRETAEGPRSIRQQASSSGVKSRVRWGPKRAPATDICSQTATCSPPLGLRRSQLSRRINSQHQPDTTCRLAQGSTGPRVRLSTPEAMNPPAAPCLVYLWVASGADSTLYPTTTPRLPLPLPLPLSHTVVSRQRLPKHPLHTPVTICLLQQTCIRRQSCQSSHYV